MYLIALYKEMIFLSNKIQKGGSKYQYIPSSNLYMFKLRFSRLLLFYIGISTIHLVHLYLNLNFKILLLNETLSLDSNIVLILILVNVLAILVLNSTFKQSTVSIESTLFLLTSLILTSFILMAKDLILIFVTFELYSYLLYLYVLSFHGKEKALPSLIKYFILSTILVIPFVIGIAILYYYTGSMDLSYITTIYTSISDYNRLLISILLIKPIIFKLTSIPFTGYALDLYNDLPSSYQAFIITIPKFVYLALLTKLIWLNVDDSFVNFFAIASLFIGGACIQDSNFVKFNEFLTYSGVANTGFLLIILTSGQFNSGLLYLFFYSLSIISIMVAFETYTTMDNSRLLANITLISRNSKLLFFATVVHLFSLIGLPPLLGFYTKMVLLSSIIGSSKYSLAIAIVLASLISTYYYLSLAVRIGYFPKDYKNRVYIDYALQSKPFLLVLLLSLSVLEYIDITC